MIIRIAVWGVAMVVVFYVITKHGGPAQAWHAAAATLAKAGHSLAVFAGAL